MNGEAKQENRSAPAAPAGSTAAGWTAGAPGALRRRQRGWFISLEGGEGSGKSTQAAVVMDWLRSRGLPCRLVREPGGTLLGERLRELLLDGAGRPVPVAEMLMFAAARAQLVETVVVPALLAGETVVCDRYVDSSLAYQGAGLGLGFEAVWAVNRLATRGVLPDLTLLFDCPPDQARARHRRPGDDIESRDAAFHERVRQGYLALAAAQGHRIVVIDASRPALDVAEAVRRILDRFFASPLAPEGDDAAFE
ncbi:dTMP kinase [Thermaerobacter litoralis]